MRSSSVLTVVVAAALLGACGDDATSTAQCEGGVDADGDGICDEPTTECTDGVDADGDGICDEPAPECTDGVDLDGDGICDEPTVECTDGVDADGDGICDRERADWTRDARIEPGTNRRDVFGLGDALPHVASEGLRHTLIWPVTVSGALLPYRPVMALFDPDTEDATIVSMQGLARGRLGFGNSDEMYDWLGLARYDGSDIAFADIPWPDGVAAGDAMGAGRIATPMGDALTFSCATCHTGEIFGRTVVGLTNRRARANEFFHLAAGFFPSVTDEVFVALTNADEAETALFLRTQQNLAAIGSVPPLVLGLDTSLAQVSLSLARREADEYASRNPELERRPRENALATFAADSKPAVWWTLKYKTRWLSDGSIVTGNPIFTNFLWNEIGRGTDLVELEQWLRDNRGIADELTAAAFATEAPRWEDFLGLDSIDVEAAQRGEVHFNAVCASCHGTYEKGWSATDASSRDAAGLIATTRVTYHAQTPVLDVGTDLQRAQGMEAFADRLNALAISQWMETVVEVQSGYVPPPLDGIWTRYPYLHNGSVPSLCELLTPASERVASFWVGPADNAETDFDIDCVGYPLGDATPASWQADERAYYDTSIAGLSNAGHDAWLLDENGDRVFDEAETRDLIEYLKTL